MSCLETKKKGPRIVFYVIVFIEREVSIVEAEIYAFYMNGSIVRICLLLVKGSVLKRVQRNTNNFSEWLVWLERPNEFSLIGVRVVLTSFFDFILSEARVLITKVNLFNVTFYFFYILRDMFYVKE